MGGAEAIAQLRRLDPQVRAIVSSGYANDPVLADYRAAGFVARIAKPYTAEDLSRVLAAALRAP
jgi:CheY-like chemotaxis protein